jgi:hypothetical protein
MIKKARLVAGLRAGLFHAFASAILVLVVSVAVFSLWYPYPYRYLAGGQNLFFLVIAVDIICGPILTAIIFDPSKRRSVLSIDLFFVLLMQVSALGYGLYSVWLARPLFLVMEIDRFKVVAAPDLKAAAAAESFAKLPPQLVPNFWSGPVVVGIRSPKSEEERTKVLFETLAGGRDYAMRPEFYLPYDGETAKKSLLRAKPLSQFLSKFPGKTEQVLEVIGGGRNSNFSDWVYVPVIGRQDWIAILDGQGRIKGFLQGDGF